jgi:drug/metabolite transporter (DMT)-like permease
MLLTLLALIAFAANSVLCRMALGAGLIDPVGFTTVRLLSGALFLVPLAWWMEPGSRRRESAGSWGSATALFAYALGFSLAYVTLDTGTGALVLFGAVQTTMIGYGIVRGERPTAVQWLGLVLAMAGLVWLVLPGITAPSPLGVVLMGLAGMAWGVYSLRGRGERRPIAATTENFLLAVPMALASSAVAVAWFHASAAGVLLAAISGAVTSGLGYVVWYMALRKLAATPAAIVQLAVPVLAAVGGVLFLAEAPSVRLAVSGVLILGGVALALTSGGGRRPPAGTGRR